MEQCKNHESMSDRLTRVEIFVEEKSKVYEKCFAENNIKIVRLEEKTKTTFNDIEEIKIMQKESLILIKKVEINQAKTSVKFDFGWKTITSLILGLAVILQVMAPYIFGLPK